MATAARVAFIICVSLLIGLVHAQQYSVDHVDVDFDVNSDMTVRQTTKFFFDEPVTDKSVNYTINEVVSGIEAFDDTQKIDADLTKNDGTYTIEIFLKNPTKTITASYDAKDIVSRGDSSLQFFSEFSFGQPLRQMNVRLKLPVGFGIYRDSYLPKEASIRSDGQRIVLEWNQTSSQGVFSVKFVELSNESNIWLAFVVFLGGVLVALYHYFRKKTKEEFLKGFREDEKRVIEYLQLKKFALQKDLETEFKFSRAKATRVVARLQEKGLLRKQKYGRTNKLTWLKR